MLRSVALHFWISQHEVDEARPIDDDVDEARPFGLHFSSKPSGFLGSLSLSVPLLLSGTSIPVLILQFIIGPCYLPMSSNARLFCFVL